MNNYRRPEIAKVYKVYLDNCCGDVAELKRDSSD